MRLKKEDIEQSISNKHFIGARVVGKQMFATMCQELLEYKEIEKDLGIDLVTLFKALKNGIYIKESHLSKAPIRFIAPDCLVFDDEYLYELKYCKGYTKLSEHSYPFYFKDYGKTWALTKEELK